MRRPYSYDALDRTAAETETHNAANLNRATTFSYEGLTNLPTQEVQATTGATTSTDTKTYTYDAYGTRISLADSKVSGGTTTPTNVLYGYNTHGDVSLLTDQADGSVKATYGYTPYGAPDTTLSKNDTSLTTPFNPYQYSAKRFDSGSQTYDMGVRRYDPSAQRFLQLDQFQGALADLTQPGWLGRAGLDVGTAVASAAGSGLGFRALAKAAALERSPEAARAAFRRALSLYRAGQVQAGDQVSGNAVTAFLNAPGLARQTFVASLLWGGVELGYSGVGYELGGHSGNIYNGPGPVPVVVSSP